MAGSGIAATARDELLMARYVAGDLRAFGELFERYEARGYAFFFARTGSHERSEDLYQELFLRIHLMRNRYDPDRPFRPWFFQVASRLLVDDARRAFRGREVGVGRWEPASSGRGSEQELADREELARLVRRLSPEERYVLVAAKVEGMGYADVAAELARSVGSVKKMAARALLRLRESALRDAPYAREGAHAGERAWSRARSNTPRET